MTKNYSFLPLLINEGIYLINDSNLSATVLQVTEPALTPNRELSIMGKNNKHVIILVNHPESPFTTTSQELLLRNILTAMNMTINDIALINLAHLELPVTVEELKRVGCSFLIGFDIPPHSIKDVDLIKNQIKEETSIKFLATFSLNELEVDKSMKMLLWKNLKMMFNL